MILIINYFFQKRSKLADNDNLYMVGGTLSPDQQHQNSNSESDGDTTYSSYESDDYRRSSYEDRRNKRREKYGGSRSERSERDRNRERRDRHNRESEKEVCLRFSEFGHCPDVRRFVFLKEFIHSNIFLLKRIIVQEVMKYDSQKKWNYASSG